MNTVYNEKIKTNNHLTDGLRILARIIAQDFLAKQTLIKNGDNIIYDSKPKYIQNK